MRGGVGQIGGRFSVEAVHAPHPVAGGREKVPGVGITDQRVVAVRFRVSGTGHPQRGAANTSRNAFLCTPQREIFGRRCLIGGARFVRQVESGSQSSAH